MLFAVHDGRHAVTLARRARVNRVKLMAYLRQDFQRIALVEFVAAISRLRPVIHSGNVEPGALIAFGATAGSTEQI